jgi:hypothetical protein
MSSSTPSGNSSSTASQVRSRLPVMSTTWWSSHTCGVWLIRYVMPPKWSIAADTSAAVPRPLVKTTGMVSKPFCRPSRRRSRSACNALTCRCLRSLRSCRWRRSTRSVRGTPPSASVSSRQMEVKSPTTRRRWGWTPRCPAPSPASTSGRRLKSVRFRVNRRVPPHIARTSENTVASSAVGVSPRSSQRPCRRFQSSGGRWNSRCVKTGLCTATGDFASGRPGGGASVAARAVQYSRALRWRGESSPRSRASA